MKKIRKNISRLRKHNLFTRVLSMTLAVVLAFCFVPTVVYAKIIEAVEEAGAADAVDNTATDTGSIGKSRIPEGVNVLLKNQGRDVTAVSEDIEKRDEYTKHYLLSDGSYLATSSAYPVHYDSGDGELTDIINYLSEAAGIYTTPTARIRFNKTLNGSGKIFTLKDGNTKLEISVYGATKGTVGSYTNTQSTGGGELGKMLGVQGLSSTVLYEDALPGVNLEYVLAGSAVKENIIVKEKSESYVYTFAMKLNSLTATLASSGDVEIMDDGGNIKYVIPAPVVYDAEGAYAPDGAAYFILGGSGNGKYTLSVVVNSEWMNGEERVFPVTVDPTVGTSRTQMYDTEISAASPSNDYYSFPTLSVSTDSTLYWGLTELPNIGKDAYIIYAALGYHTRGVDGSITVSAHRATSATQSGLNYNTYLTGSGALSENIESVMTVNSEGFYHGWDITDATRAWYNGEPNYGIGLKRLSGTGHASFFSADNSYYYPAFCITYISTAGVEDHYSYASQSAGAAGVGSVNLATGELSFAIPTLSTTDSLFSFSPTLVYNSGIAGLEYTSASTGVAYTTSYTPLGMKLNIGETVSSVSGYDTEGTLDTLFRYNDADGSDHFFKESVQSSTTYVDTDGGGLVLTPSGNQLIITDRDKMRRVFSKFPNGVTYYLTRIEDRAGNALVFSFDSSQRPTAVSILPAGNENAIEMLRLGYNSSGKLTYVYNPTSGDISVLRYNGGYLMSVDFATCNSQATEANISAFVASQSNQTNITFHRLTYYGFVYEGDGVGTLRMALDEYSGNGVLYTTTSGRVTEISALGVDEVQGEALTISYSSGYTDVRSSGNDDVINTNDDIITRYTFDSQARATSIYSRSASGGEIYGATTGEYSEKEEAKNSLEWQTVLGGSSVNYIVNGSFEDRISSTSATGWTLDRATVGTRNVGHGSGKYGLNLQPSAGTTALAAQRISLSAGKYNLSFDISTQSADGATVTVDTMGSVSIHQTLDINPSSGNGVYSFFSTDFELSSAGYIRVIISVSNPTGSTTVPKIQIDNVMVERGTKASDFSLITYGSFDATYGSTDIGDVWESNVEGESLTVAAGADGAFGNALKITANGNEHYVKQRIFNVEDPTTLTTQNSGATYVLSGYALANDAILGGDGVEFSLKMEIAYYRGEGLYDEIRTYTADFSPSSGGWQFASVTVDSQPEPEMIDGELCSFGYIRYIDVICDYSNQYRGFALFDNISVVESTGNTENYSYNPLGLVAERSSGSYYHEYYYYDLEGNLIRQADSLGNLSDFYYTNGLISSSATYRISGAAAYGYEGFAQLDTSTLTPKTTSYYGYNEYGLLTDEDIFDDSTDLSLSYRSAYETSSDSKIFGALTETRDISGTGSTYKYFYDEKTGRLLSEINVEADTGNVYTYDARGRLTGVYPAIIGSHSVYGETNAEYTEYSYNYLGMLSSIETDSTTYSFTYDYYGATDTVSIGNSEIADYTYNPNGGKVTRIDYGNGFYVRYVYDNLENLKEVWYNKGGADTKVYEYEYNADGSLYKFIDYESGKTTKYKYRNDGKLDTVTTYDTATGVHEYSRELGYNSSTGFLTSDMGDIEYLYMDGNGSSSTVTQGMNYYYTYGADNTLSQLRYSSAGNTYRLNYTYDSLGRTTRETHTMGSSSIQYDYVYGTTETYSNVEGVIYEFDTTNVETLTVKIGNLIHTYTYTYDERGNITEISSVSATSANRRYYYDNLGQLIREDNRAQNKTFVYEYDNAGNILSKKTYPYTAKDVTPSGTPTTITYTYGNSNWGDLLTVYNGEDIYYDDIGNPVEYYGNRNFTWLGRQMLTATVGGMTYSFKYNDEGLRTSKTVGDVTTTYYYSGDTLISEMNDTYTIIYVYDESGSPIGMQYREHTYAEGEWDVFLYKKNILGDVEAIYSESGTRLVLYNYDAWGNATITYSNGGASTAAAINPFRYRGYYYDTDLGLYYLKTRYYDSNTGRFISSDSIIPGTSGGVQGYNLFVYCFNNPVMYTDHDGDWPTLEEWKENSFLYNVIYKSIDFQVGIGLGIGIDLLFVEGHTRVLMGAKLSDGEWKTGEFGENSAAINIPIPGTLIEISADIGHYGHKDRERGGEEWNDEFDVSFGTGISTAFIFSYTLEVSVSYISLISNFIEYGQKHWGW